jgi:hypothetical protein
MGDQEHESKGWSRAKVIATIADAAVRLLELVVRH